MELLDRYLQAVRKHLLWGKQEDIIAELRANLESQLEEREAVLGRPLTQGEAEDWLRELGSPVQVAGRYLPQQYLIGPNLFPLYLYVLRLACTWALIIYTVATAILLITQSNVDPGEIVAATIRAPFVLLQVAAWVTFAFAVAEFVAARHPQKVPSLARFYGQWSPSELPPLEVAGKGCKRKSHVEAVAEVIFGFLGLIWLLAVPSHPFLMFGPSVWFLNEHFRLAAVWIQMYWWVIGLGAAQLFWKYFHILRGLWPESDSWPRILMKSLSLVPLFVLLEAPGQTYFFLKNPIADAARYGTGINAANHGLHVALLITGAIMIAQILVEIVLAGRDMRRKCVIGGFSH